MKQIHKDYERPFLLEKTKLDRLMDIIHDRLGEYQNTTKRDDFEVFLSGQRREEMTSVDDVLKLDNSRKSKIQRLLITCYASTEGVARPEHEIQVDFDGRAVGKNRAKVIVSVRSDDAGWSDRALSEVEEQVERTEGSLICQSQNPARPSQRRKFASRTNTCNGSTYKQPR